MNPKYTGDTKSSVQQAKQQCRRSVITKEHSIFSSDHQLKPSCYNINAFLLHHFFYTVSAALMCFVRSLWVGRLRGRKEFKKCNLKWYHAGLVVLSICFTSIVNCCSCDHARCITFNALKLWARFRVMQYEYLCLVTRVDFISSHSDSLWCFSLRRLIEVSKTSIFRISRPLC